MSELADWRLLDALRIVTPNSFDFIIETVGVFSNNDLLRKACDIIINQILLLKKAFSNNPSSSSHPKVPCGIVMMLLY